LGSAAGGTKLWSCTCEPMARGDVPGMRDSGWTSGQDAGGRIRRSCTYKVAILDVVEHKMKSTTHLILLGSLLPANAAAICCARIFVLACNTTGSCKAKLASSIAGKFKSNILKESGEHDAKYPSWSPLLDLQGRDSMYGEPDGGEDIGSLTPLAS
jgi:hypothetical protein